MIYGPGGYKYNDFLVIGTPMQLVLWIFSVGLLATTTKSNFYISWLVSLGIDVAITAIGPPPSAPLIALPRTPLSNRTILDYFALFQTI